MEATATPLTRELLKDARGVPLLERLGVKAWALDPATMRATFVSEPLAAWLGLPTDPECWLVRLDAHVHPDDRAALGDACREVARTGEVREVAYRALLPQGRTARLAGELRRLRGDDGAPTQVAAVLVAVAEPGTNGRVHPAGARARAALECRRVEDALHESEARYRSLYNYTPVMMHSIDREGRLLSVSNAWLDVLGYTRDEVLGRRSVEFLTPASRERAKAVLPEYFRTGMCRDVAYEMVKKNGEVIDVLLSAITERDARGDAKRSLAVLIDVTELKRAGAERDRLLVGMKDARDTAEREHALLDTLLRTAPIGLGFLDRELRIVQVNDALAALHGVAPADDVGRTLEEAAPGVADKIVPLVRKVLRTGEALAGVELVGEVPGLPGQQRHWLNSYYPVRTSSGEVLGVGAVIVDVTAQKRAEEAQAGLYQQAQAAIRVRDDFLAIASHELRTPLTPLVAYLHMLERAGRRGRVVDVAVVEKARRQVDKLTSLIKDLLDVSRIQTGRLALHREPLSLRALVREQVVAARVAHPTRAIDLREPEQDLVVDGDEARLGQVVANLLDNAVKYSPRGGAIEVVLGRHDREAVLSVTDAGIGIPVDQQALLFERFFRAKNAPISQYGGLGLGLYIAWDIVVRHGGTIAVESHVGHGSTFRVTLPLHAPA